MRELMLGAGSRPHKIVNIPGDPDEFDDLTTLDINPDHDPDIVWDLTQHPLPFKDSVFDRIHAYDILEHLAYQGDYEFFFAEFTEYHRILKPGGIFCATMPLWTSPGAIGDPSHRRFFNSITLAFLSQKQYKEQVGVTAMSDFRHIYKADFDILYWSEDGPFVFALTAVKD